MDLHEMDYLPAGSIKIQDHLQLTGHHTWGFVVLRTTYDDDEAWGALQDLLKQSFINCSADDEEDGREYRCVLDVAEITKSLKWTFIEDRKRLCGASKQECHTVFKEWVAEAWKKENLNADELESRLGFETRYMFFVEVDKEALFSMVHENYQPLQDRLHVDGYVNFVDSTWEPPGYSEQELMPGETREAIEGCEEEQVGWMRLAASMLTPYFYAHMLDLYIWHIYYQRPYEVVTD